MRRRLSLAPAIAGALLLVTAGAGAIAYRAQSPVAAGMPAQRAGTDPPQRVAGPARRGRCDECGFIVSAAAPSDPRGDGATREITVRFRDGTQTVVADTGAQPWRIGSRVIVIR